VMVSGSLTRLYLEPLTAGRPLLVAAYPTHALAVDRRIGEVVSLDWRPSDGVVLADEGPV
jgi:putative spermidine/putrescine transport system ATP-binding protein